MTIFRLDLSKRELAGLSAAERRLLLLLGHASNELNMLRKLMVMSRQTQLKHKSVEYVQAWQTMFVIRLLIGRIHEAWELFEKRFRDDRVASKYLPLVGESGMAALESLRQHFGKGSPLTRIRNKFTSQYGDKDDLIDASFNRLPDDEPMPFYLSEQASESFHGAADYVIAKGIMELARSAPSGRQPRTDSRGEDEAFEGLYLLTLGVADRIIALFGQCIGAIFVANLSRVPKAVQFDPGFMRRYSELDVPFFVDETE